MCEIFSLIMRGPTNKAKRGPVGKLGDKVQV